MWQRIFFLVDMQHQLIGFTHGVFEKYMIVDRTGEYLGKAAVGCLMILFEAWMWLERLRG
jgi:hypothetical protein